MSERPQGEKYEKEDEKRYEAQEKQEEKEEKSWDEKYRRDPLSAIVWAVILIWAGISFLAENLGLLDKLGPEGADAWSVIFVGAGLIVLVEVLVRTTMPEYRRPVTGTIILGVVLLGIGLGAIFDTSLVWAFALVGAGLAMLLRGLTGQR